MQYNINTEKVAFSKLILFKTNAEMITDMIAVLHSAHSEPQGVVPADFISLLVVCLAVESVIVTGVSGWAQQCATVTAPEGKMKSTVRRTPLYSRTPLMWTPWGPGEVSCIQWNPSNVDTLGTW